MTDPLEKIPAEVAAAVRALRDELSKSAGDNLDALVVYGGVARGRYRPGKSDVNVVVVLKEAGTRSLEAIAPVLRAAWRSARVEPLIVATAEVPHAAAAFPTKFLDICEHHVLISGRDAFAGLKVDRELARLRVAQELRNMLLRLRRGYVAQFGNPDAQRDILANIARPLALELAALLKLSGREAPAEDRTAAIFQSAGAAFQLDAPALKSMADLRIGSDSAVLDVADLYQRVLSLLERTALIAETLKVSAP
jgi:Nucleotidyltransferase domain